MARATLGRAIVAVAIGGCGFAAPGNSVDASDAIDAGDASDATVDAVQPPPIDGPVLVDAEDTACRQWDVTFDVDPTVVPGASGQVEWVIRGQPGGGLTGLDQGLWKTAGGVPLDTVPFDNFAGTITAQFRFRDPTMGDGPAAVWFNVGYGDSTPGIGVLVFTLAKRPGTQDFVVQTKVTGNDALVELFRVDGVGMNLVAVAVAIDVAAGTFTVALGAGAAASVAFTQGAAENADRYATLIGLSSAAEFDAIEIESCPPD